MSDTKDLNRIKMAVADLQRYAMDLSGYAPPSYADFITEPELICEWCEAMPAAPGSDPPECEQCQHLARVR